MSWPRVVAASLCIVMTSARASNIKIGASCRQVPCRRDTHMSRCSPSLGTSGNRGSAIQPSFSSSSSGPSPPKPAAAKAELRAPCRKFLNRARSVCRPVSATRRTGQRELLIPKPSGLASEANTIPFHCRVQSQTISGRRPSNATSSARTLSHMGAATS